MIGQKLRPVSRHKQTDKQTDGQTNRQTNILANFFEILASNKIKHISYTVKFIDKLDYNTKQHNIL